MIKNKVRTECKLLAYTVLFTGIYCGLLRDYYTANCMGTFLMYWERIIIYLLYWVLLVLLTVLGLSFMLVCKYLCIVLFTFYCKCLHCIMLYF
jgi:hypothetical protein